MKKKRKIWRWVIVGILIVVAVVLLILSRGSQSAAGRYTEETVRIGNLETYYSFSGNIAVRDSQLINAKANTTIREIYVEQDQEVRANDPLMRLSNGDIVKADIAGEITDVHVSEGDTVGMGAQLVDVVNFHDLQVLLKVDEFDVAAVTVGKAASVTIDAIGMTYEATVEHISKQAIEAGDINYYEAKLSAPVDEKILPGMKVDVKILNEHAEDALLLSMNALQFDAYNKPYVLTRDAESGISQTKVEVGMQDGTTVQIVSGLKEGDTVLVTQSAMMFPMMGMRQGNGQ